MQKLLAIANAHKLATAGIVATVAFGSGLIYDVVDDTTTAMVSKVVDGDTIDVTYDGEVHRVRLLNVDTPESVDPDALVECLGPEASEWLSQRLPVGTEVRLEWDQEKHDRYGRELAAVFHRDALINAEIARAGLGVAMSVAPNIKYLPPVEAAQAEAQEAERGLYSMDVECTVPAQVEELVTELTEVLGEEPATTAALAEFDAHAAELAAVMATGKRLLTVLDGDLGDLPMAAHSGQVGKLRDRVTTVQDRVESAKTSNRNARASRQLQLEEEARRAAEEAARQEAARLAAEEGARVAAEEAARKAAAERAAAAARATQRPSTPSTTTRTQAPSPSTSGSGSGPAGYTGPRCWAPGGKTWRPC